MNFLAIAELTAVLLLVLFVLRALIGVRQEHRMREGRFHMQHAIDESRGVGAVPNPLNPTTSTPQERLL